MQINCLWILYLVAFTLDSSGLIMLLDVATKQHSHGRPRSESFHTRLQFKSLFQRMRIIFNVKTMLDWADVLKESMIFFFKHEALRHFMSKKPPSTSSCDLHVFSFLIKCPDLMQGQNQIDKTCFYRDFTVSTSVSFFFQYVNLMLVEKKKSHKVRK